MPGPTITVRGEGGAIFDMDVPDEGTVQREHFDDHLDKGRLKVVSGDWPVEEPPDEAPKAKRKRRTKASGPVEEPPDEPSEDEPAEPEGDEA